MSSRARWVEVFAGAAGSTSGYHRRHSSLMVETSIER
jgi:hypothetical protein